jgi:hypothetical protein
MNTQAADLSEAVRAILKALAELSGAQTALDLDPERDHVPRDHAMYKAVAAFRAFEAGAKAVKTPLLRITISLSPK